MKRVAIFCDRCQEPILANRTNLRALCGPLRDEWSRGTPGSRPSIDLCAGCAARLTRWLAEAASVVGVAQTGPR